MPIAQARGRLMVKKYLQWLIFIRTNIYILLINQSWGNAFLTHSSVFFFQHWLKFSMDCKLLPWLTHETLLNSNPSFPHEKLNLLQGFCDMPVFYLLFIKKIHPPFDSFFLGGGGGGNIGYSYFFKYFIHLLTKKCQFSGTVLQARQKNIKKQKEISLSGHFLHLYFWIDVSWNQLGQCRSSLDLCCPSLHLGDL